MAGFWPSEIMKRDFSMGAHLGRFQSAQTNLEVRNRALAHSFPPPKGGGDKVRAPSAHFESVQFEIWKERT